MVVEGLWEERADIAARSAEIFRTNGLAAARSMDDLLSLVSDISGKPVLIERVGDESWEKLTALWFSYPDSDLVLVRSTDTELYRTHCILHELAHIIFRHPGCSDLESTEVVQALVGQGATVRGRVLRPENACVAASTPNSAIEGEAESLARLLGRSLLRPRYAADEKSFG